MPRIRSLDGLRGLAAVVVVVHHTLLVRPVLSGAFTPTYRPGPPVASADWWLLHSPLQLIWAGGEAVLIFFVLSGLVLSLAFIDGAGGRADGWDAYYPRRLARLYPPVWGALVFAVVVLVVVGGAADDSVSWWVRELHGSVAARAVLGDALLVGDPGAVINVLWSLKWEVVFSLLLPGFVAAARLCRNVSGPVVGAALVGLIVVGAFTRSEALVYLPVFGLGVLLAAHHRALEAVCSRLAPWQWALTGITGAALLMNRWFLTAVPALDQRSRTGGAYLFTAAPAAVGATMLVVVAWHCRPVARLFDSAPAQWMGHRSYSLYLVHVPIVVAVAVLLSGWSPLTVPIVLALAVLAAAVLHRLVEVPSIRWSRRLGEWAARAST